MSRIIASRKTAFISSCLVACVAAGGLLASSVVGQPESTRTGPRQYEVNIETTVDGGEVKTALSYLCMGAAQLKAPPEKVTGPRCPGQLFQRSGDTLAWTASCAAAKGEGKLTFSDGDSRFSGESTVTAGGKSVHTKVDASAVDTCSL